MIMLSFYVPMQGNVIFSELFDSIVIYNAFPHFVNRKLLFENLSKLVKTGARITVAHGTR